MYIYMYVYMYMYVCVPGSVMYPPLRCIQGIMKDRWMNIGYEDDELKPYMEPQPDLNDQARIRESTHHLA